MEHAPIASAEPAPTPPSTKSLRETEGFVRVPCFLIWIPFDCVAPATAPKRVDEQIVHVDTIANCSDSLPADTSACDTQAKWHAASEFLLAGERGSRVGRIRASAGVRVESDLAHVVGGLFLLLPWYALICHENDIT